MNHWGGKKVIHKQPTGLKKTHKKCNLQNPKYTIYILNTFNSIFQTLHNKDIHSPTTVLDTFY